MDIQAIFGLQFVLSLFVFGLLAKWEIAPRLARLSRHEALFWLTLPHAFRHVGMVFLVPGLVAQPLSPDFVIAAAYGDLAAGLLALLALVFLRSRWAGALGIVWIFSIIGTVDLLNALRHVEIVAGLGATWYIPTFLVPLLLVTHFMTFARLLSGCGTTKAQDTNAIGSL